MTYDKIIPEILPPPDTRKEREETLTLLILSGSPLDHGLGHNSCATWGRRRRWRHGDAGRPGRPLAPGPGAPHPDHAGRVVAHGAGRPGRTPASDADAALAAHALDEVAGEEGGKRKTHESDALLDGIRNLYCMKTNTFSYGKKYQRLEK